MPDNTLNLPALREAVAKGMKLLEALAEPHEQPDGDDHAWRTCRRCLALEEGETEHARQLFRALLDELEAEREKHDEGAYDDMKAAKDKAEADLAAARAVLDSTIWPSSEANGRLLLNVDAAAWHAWWQARKGLTP